MRDAREEQEPAHEGAHEDPREDHKPADHRHRLASWFREWRRPIRHWLSRRSSVPTADLDDVAQEVFLRLLRYSDAVVVDNPQGYLFRIAANVASEWRERARVRRPHDQSWLQELQIDAADEPENAAARSLVQEHVQAAVQRLPQRQRVVLLLHVNDGLTYLQIAQQLGLSYRAVLRDLTRAYSQLRMQLGADDPERRR
jgi:RNA polymerase sigma factor (sigma-70 family)